MEKKAKGLSAKDRDALAVTQQHLVSICRTVARATGYSEEWVEMSYACFDTEGYYWTCKLKAEAKPFGKGPKLRRKTVRIEMNGTGVTPAEAAENLLQRFEAWKYPKAHEARERKRHVRVTLDELLADGTLSQDQHAAALRRLEAK